ncbi:MAG: glycosyltransferase, partial [Actinomycetota bacterium]|nr:glycosyltransferase [Actinomycetota bacterium]
MEPEPIRVLRVIARLNVGGPALHVSYLTRELDRIGYETTLVAGAIGESEGSMEWVAEGLGLEPVYLPSLQREISPAHDLAAARQLLRLIRELRPDVLHTHTAKAGAVGRLAARLAGPARPRAVVHTFHGHVLRGYFSPANTA